MSKRFKQSGFTLTEVLMAAGILAVGFMLILGLFPVSVQMTAKATERTIGAVAADEAFAKIKLYGVDASKTEADTFIRFDVDSENGSDLDIIDLSYTDSLEKFYPSDEDALRDDLKYCWTAVGKRIDPNALVSLSDTRYLGGETTNTSVLMTVFVCRKANNEKVYPEPQYSTGSNYGEPTSEKIREPEPVRFKVGDVTGFKDRLKVENDTFNDYVASDAVLMNDKTGKIFRVVDRFIDQGDLYIILEKEFDWNGGNSSYIWLIPPAVESDRSGCVGVYQRIMRF